MARLARTLLWRRFAAGLTAGWRDLRGFDAVTCFLAERERWFLWLPALLGGGIAIYFLLPVEPPVLPLRLGIAALALAVLLTRWQALWHLPLLLLLTMLCGLWLGAERSAAVSAPVLQRPSGAIWLEGRVIEVEPRDAGHRLLLDDLLLPGFSVAETPQRLRITLRRDGELLWPGDRLRLRAMLLPPPEPAMPGAFDFARYAWFRQIGGVGYAISTPEAMPAQEETGWHDAAMLGLSGLRQDWTRRISAQSEGAGGAIATALMTGVRGPIPDHVDAAFRDSGLAHILSISGLHLTLVAGLLFFLVRAALALNPALALRYPIKKWAAGAALLGALAYTLLSGAALPTLRALLMIALALLAVMLDRRAITLRAVAWAALLLLIIWPDSLLDPGFQMSFAAVTALVAAFEDMASRLMRWRQQAGPLRIALLWLFGVMAASFVAGLGSSLFAAYHFNRVADYALVANLLAAPLVDFFIMPLVVLAFILMPLGLEVLALTPMVWGVDLLIALAQWVASWPDTVGTVPAMPNWGLSAVALGGLWLCLWRRRWRWLGIIGLCAGALSPWLVAQPDMLVSGEGRLLAARSGDGRFYLSRTPPRGFAAETWWERLGAPPLYPWPTLRRNETDGSVGADGSLRCDPAGCSWRHAGFLVALPQQPHAITEDCRHADVVIAARMPVRYRCPSAKVVIDRNDLWRGGTHALYLDRETGIRVVTVAQRRGRRPWVIPKGHGAAHDSAGGEGDR
ncbi:ComEC/Rec2 family competence protein [Ferrovibrio sp.]|uniref:ComEC/Rec2 family competence protein n=1 Tax=Ferrovibrio sp. TaxID=1917215 RepID=UPI00260CB494|nr:ComEC/Rec2 family competence protein [Ferrovibrio sp.]